MNTAVPCCPCGRTTCRAGHEPDRVPGLAPIHAFTPAERRSALEKLQEFVCAAPWLEDVDRDARAVFWGPQRGDPALAALDEAAGAISRRVYAAWLFFDLRMNDDRHVAEWFMDRRGSRLSPGERAYLRAALASSMRLFEIAGQGGGHDLPLRDVLDGHRATVPAPAEAAEAAEVMDRGDLLAARVVACGRSGRPRIDGVPLVIRRSLRAPLVDVLRRARESFAASRPGADRARFLETVPPLIHHVWLQPALHPVIPRLVAGAW